MRCEVSRELRRLLVICLLKCKNDNNYRKETNAICACFHPEGNRCFAVVSILTEW